jgi:hypothetical protein
MILAYFEVVAQPGSHPSSISLWSTPRQPPQSVAEVAYQAHHWLPRRGQLPIRFDTSSVCLTSEQVKIHRLSRSLLDDFVHNAWRPANYTEIAHAVLDSAKPPLI